MSIVVQNVLIHCQENFVMMFQSIMFFHAVVNMVQIEIEAVDKLPSLAKQSYDFCFLFHECSTQSN